MSLPPQDGKPLSSASSSHPPPSAAVAGAAAGAGLQSRPGSSGPSSTGLGGGGSALGGSTNDGDKAPAPQPAPPLFPSYPPTTAPATTAAASASSSPGSAFAANPSFVLPPLGPRSGASSSPFPSLAKGSLFPPPAGSPSATSPSASSSAVPPFPRASTSPAIPSSSTLPALPVPSSTTPAAPVSGFAPSARPPPTSYSVLNPLAASAGPSSSSSSSSTAAGRSAGHSREGSWSESKEAKAEKERTRISHIEVLNRPAFGTSPSLSPGGLSSLPPPPGSTEIKKEPGQQPTAGGLNSTWTALPTLERREPRPYGFTFPGSTAAATPGGGGVTPAAAAAAQSAPQTTTSVSISGGGPTVAVGQGTSSYGPEHRHSSSGSSLFSRLPSASQPPPKPQSQRPTSPTAVRAVSAAPLGPSPKASSVSGLQQRQQQPQLYHQPQQQQPTYPHHQQHQHNTHSQHVQEQPRYAPTQQAQQQPQQARPVPAAEQAWSAAPKPALSSSGSSQKRKRNEGGSGSARAAMLSEEQQQQQQAALLHQQQQQHHHHHNHPLAQQPPVEVIDHSSRTSGVQAARKPASLVSPQPIPTSSLRGQPHPNSTPLASTSAPARAPTLGGPHLELEPAVVSRAPNPIVRSAFLGRLDPPVLLDPPALLDPTAANGKQPPSLGRFVYGGDGWILPAEVGEKGTRLSNPHLTSEDGSAVAGGALGGGRVDILLSTGFLSLSGGWALRGELGALPALTDAPPAWSTFLARLASAAEAAADGFSPACSLWGTDVYTDDSDLLRVLIHSGWVVPSASASATKASGTTVLKVTLRVIGRMIHYPATERNGLRSRGWGNSHDGGSLVVEAVVRIPGHAHQQQTPIKAAKLASTGMALTPSLSRRTKRARFAQRGALTRELDVYGGLPRTACGATPMRLSLDIFGDIGYAYAPDALENVLYGLDMPVVGVPTPASSVKTSPPKPTEDANAMDVDGQPPIGSAYGDQQQQLKAVAPSHPSALMRPTESLANMDLLLENAAECYRLHLPSPLTAPSTLELHLLPTRRALASSMKDDPDKPVTPQEIQRVRASDLEWVEGGLIVREAPLSPRDAEEMMAMEAAEEEQGKGWFCPVERWWWAPRVVLFAAAAAEAAAAEKEVAVGVEKDMAAKANGQQEGVVEEKKEEEEEEEEMEVEPMEEKKEPILAEKAKEANGLMAGAEETTTETKEAEKEPQPKPVSEVTKTANVEPKAPTPPLDKEETPGVPPPAPVSAPQAEAAPETPSEVAAEVEAAQADLSVPPAPASNASVPAVPSAPSLSPPSPPLPLAAPAPEDAVPLSAVAPSEAATEGADPAPAP